MSNIIMQQETVDSFKVVDQNNRGYVIQIDYDRVPFNAQAQFVVSGVTEPPSLIVTGKTIYRLLLHNNV